MTVELTPSQEALIQEQLETGRYHSRAEVIADALELLSDHARLEQMKLDRLRPKSKKGWRAVTAPRWICRRSKRKREEGVTTAPSGNARCS